MHFYIELESWAHQNNIAIVFDTVENSRVFFISWAKKLYGTKWDCPLSASLFLFELQWFQDFSGKLFFYSVISILLYILEDNMKQFSTVCLNSVSSHNVHKMCSRIKIGGNFELNKMVMIHKIVRLTQTVWEESEKENGGKT